MGASSNHLHPRAGHALCIIRVRLRVLLE